jgi:hypothetical protein
MFASNKYANPESNQAVNETGKSGTIDAMGRAALAKDAAPV